MKEHDPVSNFILCITNEIILSQERTSQALRFCSIRNTTVDHFSDEFNKDLIRETINKHRSRDLSQPGNLGNSRRLPQFEKDGGDGARVVLLSQVRISH